jgi:hypothetical protein
MAAGSVAAGHDVETVQADPDQIMINKLDDPPGVAVVVQEAAPGQGPVRDPHAVALRKITEPAELAGEELIIVDGDQDALDHRSGCSPTSAPAPGATFALSPAHLGPQVVAQRVQ